MANHMISSTIWEVGNATQIQRNKLSNVNFFAAHDLILNRELQK